MSPDYFYGLERKSAPKPSVAPQRRDLRGESAIGRVVRVLTGQGHGFVRLRDDREVFFHRSDVCDGTAFNDLQVGDTVAFELFEDSVSGARALRVKLSRRQATR